MGAGFHDETKAVATRESGSTLYSGAPGLLWSEDGRYLHPSKYLGADEIEAPSVGTQVDEVLARAEQAQFVGLTPGRLSVHLIGNEEAGGHIICVKRGSVNRGMYVILIG